VRPYCCKFKEAQQSVLEAFAGASAYPNHGQREIVGERYDADWHRHLSRLDADPVNGRYFYVRRPRIHDSPMSEPVSKQVAVLRRALRPYPGTGSCAGRRCRRIFGLYDKEFDKANRLRCETFLLCTHGRAEMRGEY
jgi:hypothetical protein